MVILAEMAGAGAAGATTEDTREAKVDTSRRKHSQHSHTDDSSRLPVYRAGRHQ